MAYGMILMFGRCDIPLPFHLYVKALPRNTKILSQVKGEKKYFSEVEQVMDEEK